MELNLLDDRRPGSVALQTVARNDLESWLKAQPASVSAWVAAMGFDAKPGSFCPLPDLSNGGLREVVVGEAETLWDWASLPSRLPRGSYHLESSPNLATSDRVALGWALGSYRFDSFRERANEPSSSLTWPDCNRDHVRSAAYATYLVRDWINTPASDLGPAELAQKMQELASAHDASLRVVVGDALLEEGFPAVHAVGRAASPARAPRLIDMTWGDPTHPKVTLVGKGVCFDTGGLDLKSASNMKLMKKDMGGAAHVAGLAHMIMAAKLPVRLRVLVPAVENSVSSDAYRPLDVVPTRKGITIEVGHTDAEGRVILADALEEASREKPEILIDFATLTGAARVALGAELPALFANDDDTASSLLAHATAAEDPMWRMPLWKPYRSLIDGKVADITNSAEGSLGGAITAALFLQEFVGDDIPWAHIDAMAWNPTSRAGRPEGGEALGMRAAYGFIEERFGSSSSSSE